MSRAGEVHVFEGSMGVCRGDAIGQRRRGQHGRRHEDENHHQSDDAMPSGHITAAPIVSVQKTQILRQFKGDPRWMNADGYERLSDHRTPSSFDADYFHTDIDCHSNRSLSMAASCVLSYCAKCPRCAPSALVAPTEHRGIAGGARTQSSAGAPGWFAVLTPCICPIQLRFRLGCQGYPRNHGLRAAICVLRPQAGKDIAARLRD